MVGATALRAVRMAIHRARSVEQVDFQRNVLSSHTSHGSQSRGTRSNRMAVGNQEVIEHQILNGGDLNGREAGRGRRG